MTENTAPDAPLLPRHWGLWAVVCGALSMVLIFVQMALLSNQETASVGQQIGQIAGDIKRSAWQSFFGISPTPKEPEPVPFSMQAFEVLFVVTPIVAGVAIILAAISLLKHENWRFGFYGISLGIGAMMFQFLWWMALVILGMLLLIKVVENIGDIFSFGG